MELATKRFKEKSSEDAAEEIFKMIEGKSPVIFGVTVSHTASTVLQVVSVGESTAAEDACDAAKHASAVNATQHCSSRWTQGTPEHAESVKVMQNNVLLIM